MSQRATLRRLETELGEVLASHEKGHDLEAFAEYDGEPVRFASEVLEVELWEKQEAILRALEDHPQVLVHGGNAVGKDFVAAVWALYWVFVKRGLVLATAAVERQVVDVFMHMTVGALWRPVPELPGELLRNSLRLPGHEAVGIVSFTATAVERLTGYHADRVACVLTESQGLEPFAWQGLQRSAAGPEDRMLAVGNPNRATGPFRERAASESWHTIGVSVREHPNVVQGETVIPGGPSPDFVRRMREDWGPEHPVFQSSIEGRFPTSDVMGLIERPWLEEAAERFEGDAFPEDRWEEDPVVAVDVARYGDDSTVCCVRRGRVVSRFEAWSGASTEETAGRVMKLAGDAIKRWNDGRGHGVRIVVDETGVGGGVLDALEARGMDVDGMDVEGFNGGEAARDGDTFANRRAEAFWRLREQLESGELAVPADEGLWEELTTLRWEVTSTGKTKMEPKDAWRGRISSSSPDRADALSMAVYDGGTRPRVTERVTFFG